MCLSSSAAWRLARDLDPPTAHTLNEALSKPRCLPALGICFLAVRPERDDCVCVSMDSRLSLRYCVAGIRGWLVPIHSARGHCHLGNLTGADRETEKGIESALFALPLSGLVTSAHAGFLVGFAVWDCLIRQERMDARQSRGVQPGRRPEMSVTMLLAYLRGLAQKDFLSPVSVLRNLRLVMRSSKGCPA